MLVPYLQLVIELFKAQNPWRELLRLMASYLSLDQSYRQTQHQPKGKPRPVDT